MSKIHIISKTMDIKRHLESIRAEKQKLSGYTDQDFGFLGSLQSQAEAEQIAAKAIVKAARRNPILDFKFNITNTGSAALDRVISLTSPLDFDETDIAAAGYVVDGVLRTGQVVPGATPGTDDVVAAGSLADRPIELLRNFMKYNNLRVIGITISSNTTRSFETDLQVVQLNPFKKEEERTIDLSNYFRSDNLTGKKIEADLVNDNLDFSFDNQTLVRMSLPSGSEMTMTLRFGGVDNPAAKFNERAETTFVSPATEVAAMGSGGSSGLIKVVQGLKASPAVASQSALGVLQSLKATSRV